MANQTSLLVAEQVLIWANVEIESLTDKVDDTDSVGALMFLAGMVAGINLTIKQTVKVCQEV